jgi:hypothetical protein
VFGTLSESLEGGLNRPGARAGTAPERAQLLEAVAAGISGESGRRNAFEKDAGLVLLTRTPRPGTWRPRPRYGHARPIPEARRRHIGEAQPPARARWG